MRDNSALYALVGALGGAGITGLAAVYSPLRLALLASRRARTSALVRVRTASKMVVDVLEQTIQELEAGVPAEVGPFNETMRDLFKELSESCHDLAQVGLWADTAGCRGPMNSVGHAIKVVREEVLQFSLRRRDSVRPEAIESLARAKMARERLNEMLLREVQRKSKRRIQRF